MIKPIVINAFGEEVCVESSVQCKEEDIRLQETFLIHNFCGSPVNLQQISQTHYSLVCLHCRRLPDPVAIPLRIDTYGELRHWCADRIAKEVKDIYGPPLTPPKHPINAVLGGDCDEPPDSVEFPEGLGKSL